MLKTYEILFSLLTPSRTPISSSRATSRDWIPREHALPNFSQKRRPTRVNFAQADIYTIKHITEAIHIPTARFCQRYEK